MPTQKPKPTDVTGRTRAALAEQFEKEQQDRAGEMSMISAQAKADLDVPVDATVPNRATVIVDNPVELAKPDEDRVEIRVIEDIENMTLGKGNNYNFKAGQKYVVTRHVATHLKEKGYLAASF
jgi:hypothetical protein